MPKTPPAEGNKAPYSVGAVQRALRIVDFLAARPHLEAGVSEIADGLGLPRPTVHRLLANLEHFGYVAQDEVRGTYQLGLRLMEYGNLVSAELSIVSVARPHIRRLMEQTGETVHLAVLDGRHIVYIDKIEPDRAIRMVSRVGARLPAHCTALGKAILAQLPAERLDGLLEGVELEQPTPRTAGDLRTLRDRLAEVQRLRYAVDDEEVEEGLRCLGAAVVDRSGTPMAAVSLSAPIERMSRERMSEVGPLVVGAADAIAEDLGRVGSAAVA